MTKQYELTEVRKINCEILFNHEVMINKIVNYHILKIKISGIGMNPENCIKKRDKTSDLLGDPRVTKFSPQEIYTELNTSSDFSERMAQKLKRLYIKLIDVNISE